MNRVIRATSKNQEVRAFVAETKDLVNKGIEQHQTTPVASAALGRTLTAGAMMGAMMKNERDMVTITIKGEGPLGGVLVTANGRHEVKGYVDNPLANVPNKANGKLDVSGSIGKGVMTVVRDLGLKDPYVGQIDLVSGEIADDLTYYYATSEQTNSVVALGVLVDKDYTIKQSGGFIIQLMPGVTEETIVQIEENIRSIHSVTAMLEQGLTGEDILNKILDKLEPRVLEVTSPDFVCHCNKHKFERHLLTLAKADLEEMIDDDETIETTCHFCNSHYYFTNEELKAIYKEKQEKENEKSN